MDTGHWQCEFDFEIIDLFGFIYLVTNTQNGMQYIGRKQFYSITRKKIKGRKNRKVIKKESKWREYTTSSRIINELIEEFDKDIFVFEIIELCKTKGELTYREVELQWENKVLSAKLPDGSRKYYNSNIGAIKFRLDKHSEESKQKMSETHTGKKLLEETSLITKECR